MTDITYARIDGFLQNDLIEMDLYIQEGSGGYYISRKKANDHGERTFINRVAQIVEDEGEYKLAIKDMHTGQWGEYELYNAIDDCLCALKQELLTDKKAHSSEPVKDQMTTVKTRKVQFACWSCLSNLLEIKGNGKPLFVSWADRLESIEILCPACEKTILYDFTSEEDVKRVFLPDDSNEEPIAAQHHQTAHTQPTPQDTTPVIKIDFEDLIWRMKDHTHGSEHYLNLRTGRLERIDINKISKNQIGEYDSYPWLRIIPVPSKEAYGAMEVFVSEIENDEQRDLLEQALMGPKPFKSFKFTLQQFEDIQENWHEYEREFYLQNAREWLDRVEIKYELLP